MIFKFLFWHNKCDGYKSWNFFLIQLEVLVWHFSIIDIISWCASTQGERVKADNVFPRGLVHWVDRYLVVKLHWVSLGSTNDVVQNGPLVWINLCHQLIWRLLFFLGFIWLRNLFLFVNAHFKFNLLLTQVNCKQATEVNSILPGIKTDSYFQGKKIEPLLRSK